MKICFIVRTRKRTPYATHTHLKKSFLYLKKVSYQHFWKLVDIDNSLVASRKINWAFHVSRKIPVSKPVESTLANYRKLSKAPVIQLVIT